MKLTTTTRVKKRPLRRLHGQACFPPPRLRTADSAFTLAELLIVFGVLGLLVMLAAPVLANNKGRSQRAVCVNNLAQIGQALALWGTDRGDLYPWQLDYSVEGTRSHPSGLNNNVWFQFAWISNELRTPKFLGCPADPLVKLATDFSTNRSGGFLSPFMRNEAISYILGHPFAEYGRLVVSADRNISPAGSYSACGYFQAGVPELYGTDLSRLAWNSGLHSGSGNLLFNDGSIEQADNTGLRSAISKFLTTGGSQSLTHFVYPRPPMEP